MPRYQFRCKICNRETEDTIPVKLCDDKDMYPICCKEPMAKLLSAVPFKFDVPPSGHYFPTVGKTCSTAAEYQREADKVKNTTWKQEEKDVNLL